jgi:hypothetical protein
MISATLIICRASTLGTFLAVLQKPGKAGNGPEPGMLETIRPPVHGMGVVRGTR